MIPVGLRPAANRDLLEAVTWYENQQPGLGVRFFNDFDRAHSRIEESRDQFPRVYRDVRRILLRNFPFGVFFGPYGDQTVVIAIADLRREPGWWRERT